jgi:hypothetical protein
VLLIGYYRVVKALQESGISTKTYPVEGKKQTTMNADLRLPDNRSTLEMFGFLSVVLKK